MDQERVATWSETLYTNESLVKDKGHNFYNIHGGTTHAYMRHELLKIT